jgi:alpha-1,3-mannosyltransferase
VRVVHVVRQFHPGVGGLENFVLSLAKQQRLEGVNAEVVTLDRLYSKPSVRLLRHDSVEGVPVHRIGFSGSSRYPIAPEVLSHIEPFDIVHVHGVDFFCDFLAATRVLHRKPLVLSTHGGFFHTNFGRFLKPIFFHTVTRASLWQYRRIFACSAGDEAIFRKVAGRRVVRIDNGVDTNKFAGLASRKFVPTLVYFGRFSANKGLDRLVDAFDVLCDELPRARLHIMGRDWGDLLPALKERIHAARHGTAITVHEAPSDDDIRRVISASSYFVSASQYEGFGLTLVEALAAGLLPIVSPLPSFASILGGSDTGLPVQFDDAQSAGKEMASFIRETAKGYGTRRSEAMQLSSRYAWPKVSGRFVREYQDLLGWHEREIFGVRIRPMSRWRALSVVDRALAAGQRLNVSFANAHTLNMAAANDRFRAALQSFLVLNDGLGVDIASRYKFGKPFAGNLNGTDFVPDYLAFTRRRLRIYLVGTSDAVVTTAVERLRARYPRHTVVGGRNGFFAGPEDIEETCRTIRAARADCVLVGMGNPLQELWIDEFGAKTGAKLLFGVGALFDFEAGAVRRAPMWIRRMRCEWVYRLLQEPRRLARRYIVGNFGFLLRVLVEARQVPLYRQ